MVWEQSGSNWAQNFFFIISTSKKAWTLGWLLIRFIDYIKSIHGEIIYSSSFDFTLNVFIHLIAFLID